MRSFSGSSILNAAREAKPLELNKVTASIGVVAPNLIGQSKRLNLTDPLICARQALALDARQLNMADVGPNTVCKP